MTPSLLYIPELFGISFEVYIICLLIAVTTFLFCSRLLKKFIKANETRRLVAWIIALVATPFIYLGLIALLLFGITYTPGRDFDKAQWLTDKEGRYQMAGDLINSNMIIGKDISQVKEILGEPTWSIDSSNSCVYDMGFGGGGLGFMFHNLVIRFSKGKAVSVEHMKIRD